MDAVPTLVEIDYLYIEDLGLSFSDENGFYSFTKHLSFPAHYLERGGGARRRLTISFLQT